MTNPDMICKQCGSVLSAVTFTCVRDEYCKPKPVRAQCDELSMDEDFAGTPHPSAYYERDDDATA